MIRPPSPRAGITLANWRLRPFSQWSFQHVQEFVPVATITSSWKRGAGPAAGRPLERLVLEDPGGGKLGAIEHLKRSHTDSFVVMRNWQIVGEWYRAGVDPALPHIVFSVLKSVTRGYSCRRRPG
jgi:CubicO group peptidase (beta-lactamase class C family)